ncbi:hypothetical protein SEA_NIOBE_53 [Arthrobacter phage Niobe]|nr:hypothetical protein SEA_LONDON_53 [Arthrobacter phage London]UAJ15414.1 hypothetical protein SEA_ASA16_53 [Arthrobacter phage Asa16]
MNLGERQYRHRHGRALRVTLAIGRLIRDPYTRRAQSLARREIRAYRVTPLIHNGRKPKK